MLTRAPAAGMQQPQRSASFGRAALPPKLADSVQGALWRPGLADVSDDATHWAQVGAIRVRTHALRDASCAVVMTKAR